MPTPKLSKEVIAETLALVKKHGGNIADAAKAAGIPRQTLYARYQQALQHKDGEESAEVRVLRERIRVLEAAARAREKDKLGAEYVKRAIIKLSSEVEASSAPEWVLRPSSGKGVAGVPTAIWSDWHWAEVVRPSEVNGVNEYNLAIAHERVQRLVSGTISLLSNYTVHTGPWPGIVVNLGGDMVSGDIHEELAQTNEVPTMAAVVDIVGVLTTAVRTLADHFGRVFLPCVTGNHGRTSRKPRHAGRVWTNYDWLIYQFLAKQFENDDRVRFMIGEGTDVLYSVYSHRYLLTHGDNLGKGGDGIIGMFGPVVRGMKARSNRNQAVDQSFDTVVCGHYHQCVITDRFIVNGSLCGAGVFSHNLALGFEKPQQALWLTHPTRGLTIKMPVHLEDGNPYKGGGAEWVSWSKR